MNKKAREEKRSMRLDKYLCTCTSFSRSQAKALIRKAAVRIDGSVVKDPSQSIDGTASVVFQGRTLMLPRPRYLMLHKPLGTVCTSIEADSRSVLSLLDVPNVNDLHIAGRLDIDTTGLVLLTDDGAWSHKITAPVKQKSKQYRVSLAEPLLSNAEAQFKSGIQLKGEQNLTRPARLDVLSSQDVRLTLQEGKYHQVKRMFAALGNRVVGLHREQVGDIQLDDSLAPGEWRWLREAEIASV